MSTPVVCVWYIQLLVSVSLPPFNVHVFPPAPPLCVCLCFCCNNARYPESLCAPRKTGTSTHTELRLNEAVGGIGETQRYLRECTANTRGEGKTEGQTRHGEVAAELNPWSSWLVFLLLL